MKLRISSRAKNFLKKHTAKNKLRNMQAALEHYLVETNAIEAPPEKPKAAPVVDLSALRKRNDYEAMRIRQVQIEAQAKALKAEKENLEKAIAKGYKPEESERIKELKAEQEVKDKDEADKKAKADEAAAKQKKEAEVTNKAKAEESKLDKKRADIKEKQQKEASERLTADRKKSEETLTKEREAAEKKGKK